MTRCIMSLDIVCIGLRFGLMVKILPTAIITNADNQFRAV